jgi:hypothetical protein
MNPNKPIVIHHPHELSIRWAQRIVRRFARNARVFGVKLRSVDVGTSTRLRVEVEHDALNTLPTRWFVKTPS